jgi:NAD(P)-dependent dehydrogenase (short-subunit alcohol dehydrogenase family)
MASFFQTILVTGSSRGIGLGLVKTYLSKSSTRVIATCRAPESAHELTALKTTYGDRLEIFPLDITSKESLATLKSSLVSNGISSLDILIGSRFHHLMKSQVLTSF